MAESQRKIPTRKGKKKSLDAAESVWMATGGRSSAASPMTNCMVAPITSAAARMMAPAKAVADRRPSAPSAAREAARSVPANQTSGIAARAMMIEEATASESCSSQNFTTLARESSADGVSSGKTMIAAAISSEEQHT